MKPTSRPSRTYVIHAFGQVIRQTTSRLVTHAIISRNHRGDQIVMLTRSPLDAAKRAKSWGDRDIETYLIVNGVASNLPPTITPTEKAD